LPLEHRQEAEEEKKTTFGNAESLRFQNSMFELVEELRIRRVEHYGNLRNFCVSYAYLKVLMYMNVARYPAHRTAQNTLQFTPNAISSSSPKPVTLQLRYNLPPRP